MKFYYALLYTCAKRSNNIKCLLTRKNIIEGMTKENLFYFGLAINDDDLCIYSLDYGYTMPEHQFIHQIIIKGKIKLMEYIYNNNIKIEKHFIILYIKLALENAQYDTAIWLHKHGYQLNGHELINSSYPTKMTMDQFTYFFENNIGTATNNLECIAADSGRLDMLQFLHDNDTTFSNDAMAIACSSGNMDSVNFLRQLGREFDEDSMATTALNGKLDMLKYLREQNCPMNEFATEAACTGHHLDCLEFLLEQNCEINAEKCAQAAVGYKNDPTIIQYLCEHGYQFDHISACTNAAKFGMDKTLRYMCENIKKEHNFQAYLDMANTYGDAECIEYLTERIRANEPSSVS